MIWDFGAIDPRFFWALGLLYAGMSLLTLVTYAFDKWAAIKGWQRVPEDTLHAMAIIGGWPGALVAQRLVRHKTRKQPFRLIFWITVLVNIAVLLWLLSKHGQTILSPLYSALQ